MAGILLATLVGYIVTQGSIQEAETQTRDESGQQREDPIYEQGSQRQAATDRIIVKLEEGATRSDLEEVNDQNNASTEKDLSRSR